MSAISDSSQEASNAGINSCSLTPASSPKIFIKTEMPDLQPTSIFRSGSALLKPNASSEQSQKRRSSSRSIKRKKFDDELVESSLIKTSRARPQNVTFPMLSPSVCISSPSVTSTPTFIASNSQTQTEVTPILNVEKKKPRPSQKRIKKPKNTQAHLAKDVSRWKPADDLTLILSVQQTNDLETVYRGVKFSSKFTLREVQERWYALLYDSTISKAAIFAMKQLNPELIAQIQAKVLFSAEEERFIASVPSTKGSLDVFQKLLDSNASVFLPSRTAKVLHSHWTLMKQYNLLHDQTAQQPLPIENLLSFSDAEELLDDAELQDPKDVALDEELSSASRRNTSEIRQLENELSRWQVLVDCVTGVSLPEFDSKTYAVLRGRIVRFLIQTREVTLGRSAKDNSVDIDLSLEGPSSKISRRQAVIKLDSSGDFYIFNEGKKPFYVDGKAVISGSKSKINTSSVVEITVLRFIFIVNPEAISNFKAKST